MNQLKSVQSVIIDITGDDCPFSNWAAIPLSPQLVQSEIQPAEVRAEYRHPLCLTGSLSTALPLPPQEASHGTAAKNQKFDSHYLLPVSVSLPPLQHSFPSHESKAFSCVSATGLSKLDIGPGVLKLGCIVKGRRSRSNECIRGRRSDTVTSKSDSTGNEGRKITSNSSLDDALPGKMRKVLKAEFGGQRVRHIRTWRQLHWWLVPDGRGKYWPCWTFIVTVLLLSCFFFMAGQYQAFLVSKALYGSSEWAQMVVSLTPGPTDLLSWLAFWSTSSGGNADQGLAGTIFNAPYLLLWGAKYNPNLAAGKWWLWLTSLFVHESFSHLLSNLVLFMILCSYLECNYGTLRVCAIYMLSGIVGNFSSTIFEDRCEVVVGASGCIFGLLGLYLSDIALNFESLSLPWLRLGTLIVALTFLITTQVTFLGSHASVSNFSHIGGGLTGLCLAPFFLPNLKDRRWRALQKQVEKWEVSALLEKLIVKLKREQPVDVTLVDLTEDEGWVMSQHDDVNEAVTCSTAAAADFGSGVSADGTQSHVQRAVQFFMRSKLSDRGHDGSQDKSAASASDPPTIISSAAAEELSIEKRTCRPADQDNLITLSSGRVCTSSNGIFFGAIPGLRTVTGNDTQLASELQVKEELTANPGGEEVERDRTRNDNFNYCWMSMQNLQQEADTADPPITPLPLKGSSRPSLHNVVRRSSSLHSFMEDSANMDAPDGQIILEEEVDENYEPTQQEILEYAQWLGMDAEKEKELMWIAKEGLKAPLPQSWKPCKTPGGDIYYFNFSTGESIWDHPCDEFYRKLYQDEKAKLENKNSAPKQQNAVTKPRQMENNTTFNASPLGPLKKEPLGALRSSGGNSNDSLHNSFDNLPLAPIKEGLKPLPGPLKPLSASGDLPSLGSKLVPLSGSGSDWKDPHESSSVVRMRQEEERSALERRLKSEFEADRADLERQYRQRLSSVREELEDEERNQKRKMLEATDLVISEYKKQMEAREAREKEEAALDHKRRVLEFEENNQQQLVDLRKEKERLEEQLRKQIAAAKQDLQNTSTLAESEVSALRAKALKDVEEDSKAWAEVQKVSIRQKKMDEAMNQVEAELAPLRAAKREEAMKHIEEELNNELKIKKQQVAETHTQLSDVRKQLESMERQFAEKKAKTLSLDVDVESRSTQLPKLESDLKLRQKELQEVEHQVYQARQELQKLEEELRLVKKELSSARLELLAQETQVRALSADHSLKVEELAAVKVKVSTETASLEASKAAAAAQSQLLVEASTNLAHKQRLIAEVETQLKEASRSLAEAEAEVARIKADAITRDNTIAAELRGQASAEYQQLEQELTRTRKELEAVSSKLDERSYALAQQEDRLERVLQDMHEGQSRSSQIASEIRQHQGDLSALEKEIADKRQQLDRVASALLVKQKELEFESQRASLTFEEKSLLEVQRAQMERAVSEQVAEEKRALLSKRTAKMRSEVEEMFAGDTQKAAQSERFMSPSKPQRALPMAVDMGLSALDEVLLEPPTSSKSPRIPAQTEVAPAERQVNHHLHSASVVEAAYENPALLTEPWPHHGQESMDPLLHGQQGQIEDILTRFSRAVASQGPYAKRSSVGSDMQRASLLSNAKFFISQQKKFIKERQTIVQAARDDWKFKVATLGREPSPQKQQHQAQVLQLLKASLEKQILSLNEDATKLNVLKREVRALEANQAVAEESMSKISGWQLHGQPQPVIDSGLLEQLSAHLLQRNTLYEEEDEGLRLLPNMESLSLHPGSTAITRGSPSTTRAVNPISSQARGDGGSGLHAVRASLEQISAAVNSALQATQSVVHAQDQGAYRTTHVNQQSSLLDNLTRSHNQRPLIHPRAASAGRGRKNTSNAVPGAHLPTYAWSSDVEEGDYGQNLWDSGNMSRLREEHDLAQTMLQQHSSWLRGFREQIGRVSASNSTGGGGPTTGQSGLLSGGMHGSGLNASLTRSSMPMRIPIGNNQEVVVSVQPKF
ncbi:hypothetical protein CEUSTIGMA_g12516.t1 [Chlamydomonas eustigma]|uniref:Centrosomal protein of 164 kDa n=1 Tax=Chlamydomonas eustigma TaxID=1157962 RepID=A0A250XPX9_9CHLO|nr:hypothetical protein CEUSTIGMA_g12516.t1 [Chlamydomonas eustigma]|eukprot:GAX85096.1 hypothetical protein CEUSTIGMA_g12516.t1 [Chlamydomonas eustigma]